MESRVVTVYKEEMPKKFFYSNRKVISLPSEKGLIPNPISPILPLAEPEISKVFQQQNPASEISIKEGIATGESIGTAGGVGIGVAVGLGTGIVATESTATATIAVGSTVGATAICCGIGAFFGPFLGALIGAFLSAAIKGIERLFTRRNPNQPPSPPVKFQPPPPKITALVGGMASASVCAVKGALIGIAFGPLGIFLGTVIGAVIGFIFGATGGYLGGKCLQQFGAKPIPKLANKINPEARGEQ